jgi:hypothetical protein
VSNDSGLESRAPKTKDNRLPGSIRGSRRGGAGLHRRRHPATAPGQKGRLQGRFRDPVRSSGKKALFTLGIRWFGVGAWVTVPGSQQLGALPFFVVPALWEKTCPRLKKRHCSRVGWLQVVIPTRCRWLPGRPLGIVGESGFAAVEGFATCQAALQPVRLVVRWRLDATLSAPLGPQPKRQRGPKPKKGGRLPNVKARLTPPQTRGQRVTLRW